MASFDISLHRDIQLQCDRFIDFLYIDMFREVPWHKINSPLSKLWGADF
jgi:hypothetical protein